MRSKVDAIDYKYFVEPNIPPFVIDDNLLKDIKDRIPMLADERKELYLKQYLLDEESANIIVKNKDIADYYEECLKLGINAKTAANWLNGLITSYLYKNEINIKDFYLKPNYLKQIIDAINEETISSKQAKDIFNQALDKQKEPKTFITSEDSQISDTQELDSIINNILDNSSTQIEEYHNGRTNIFDYFVGQVMKETRGKANPVKTKELLHQKLDEK